MQARRVQSGSVDSSPSPLIEQSPPASSKCLFGQLRSQAETVKFFCSNSKNVKSVQGPFSAALRQ